MPPPDVEEQTQARIFIPPGQGLGKAGQKAQNPDEQAEQNRFNQARSHRALPNLSSAISDGPRVFFSALWS